MRSTRLFQKPAVSAVAALVATAATTMPTSAQPTFSAWSTPAAILFNAGGCPIESRNGLRLYVARFGADKETRDIFVYERRGRSGAFADDSLVADPVSLPDANDFCPTPLQDKWLMFVSDRDIEGACGGTDMYITKYNPAKGWREPTHLGCAPDGPNTGEDELSPSLVTTSAGTQLYFSTGPLIGPQDLFVSTMAPDGSFGPGAAIDELNTDGDDRQPNVRRDGLEMVFARDGNIWSASRASVEDPWSGEVDLSVSEDFPTEGAGESRPSLSWDGKRLYYGSGGTIYSSERSPGRGPK